MKRDAAFTGLEAAIVLIAFVVVAAVFSYVMLGVGFFATQKAQEVTYAGIKQSVSNIVLDGSVYANKASTGHIDHLTLGLMVPEGGDPQELTELLLLFSSRNAPIPYAIAFDPAFDGTAVPVDSTTVAVGTFGVLGAQGDADANTLITPGAKKTIFIALNDDGTTAPAGPAKGGWFQIEIKPKVGAPTTIYRSVAAGFAGGQI
jgi:flagellin FlaB